MRPNQPPSLDIPLALQSISDAISEAREQFNQWAGEGDDYHDPAWIIESCFLQLLAVAELLGVEKLRAMIHKEYVATKRGKDGFSHGAPHPDGGGYSTVLARISCYNAALRRLFPSVSTPTSFAKDLLQVLRDMHYYVTDKCVFDWPPRDEEDVHRRIEAVLKCVFPDLKHKPVLCKQIKNFVPDTGIPSLQALIEYKFLSRHEDVGKMADQILADTRGYASRDWTRFVYVVYETHRFKSEHDWNQLLRDSQVATDTAVVVLTGEPPAEDGVSGSFRSEKRTQKDRK